MLAQEAAKMGVRLRVLDPAPGCPAAGVAEQARPPAALKVS